MQKVVSIREDATQYDKAMKRNGNTLQRNGWIFEVKRYFSVILVLFYTDSSQNKMLPNTKTEQLPAEKER